MRAEIKNVSAYTWLIFTSRNAVQIFWEQLLGGARDARALAGLKIAAVGPATAGALLEHGIAVDLIPERFVAEGLLEKFSERDDVSGAKVLYVTAEGAREVLPEGLTALGAEVNVIDAYRSIQDGSGSKRLMRAVESGTVSVVTFTSASAVRSYVDVVGEELALKTRAASIGPQTTEAITAAGIELLCEAEESTTDGLVAAVVRSLS